MCGRIDAHDPVGINNLVSILDIVIPGEQLPPRYNIAPGASIAALSFRVGFDAESMHWGIVPHWAKPGQFERPLINARAETIREKPSFRKLIQRTRAIIPVNGFYEWRRTNGDKATYYFHSADQGAIALGGIYQTAHDGEKQCCVITTDANALMRPVHDRMPLIIPREGMQDWLRSNDAAVIDGLMRVCVDDALALREVSSYVNSTRHDGERCITPV